MLIRWIGHSCFRLTMNDGATVVTDPFDGSVGYERPRGHVDLVTISHEHFDHNHIGALEPETVIRDAGHFPGKVAVTGFASFHDDAHGAKRGPNVMFLIEGDGARVLHLGDLGHDLSDAQIAAFGRVDALLVPVGGVYTIDARQAAALARRIGARVTVPMHYKTPRLTFELGGVELFIEAMGGRTAACETLDPLNPPAEIALMAYGQGIE